MRYHARQCREHSCSQPFVIDEKEAAFYIDKGMELPARCKECRARRRLERETAQQVEITNQTNEHHG